MELKRATPTIDELKTITEKHLSNELDIMEMILGLDEKHIEEFYRWYINHPYRKGIGEIKEIVRQAKSNREYKKFSTWSFGPES
jgi:glutamyl-tRNA reductase